LIRVYLKREIPVRMKTTKERDLPLLVGLEH
jgi:hypothetical protein